MSNSSEPDRYTSAGVQRQHRERLLEFRQRYPLQEIQHKEHRWTYYDTGNVGDPTLLLLHGGGGDAEAMFRYINGFSQQFRVIAPNIPPTVKHMEQVTAGLHGIVMHEGISQLHLFGTSFGGYVAQVYLRQYRDLIENVVLTHTTSPAPHIAERANMQRAFIAFYPSPVLMWLHRRTMRQTIDAAPDPAPAGERAFWKTYFDHLYSTRFNKKHILSRSRLTVDYHRKFTFRSSDLDGWYGQVLLIESEYDEVYSEGERGAIQTMYPRATVQTMRGRSHLAVILCPDMILDSANEFLLEASATYEF